MILERERERERERLWTNFSLFKRVTNIYTTTKEWNRLAAIHFDFLKVGLYLLESGIDPNHLLREGIVAVEPLKCS